MSPIENAPGGNSQVFVGREGRPGGSRGNGLQDWERSTTSAEVLLAFYKEMLIKD